MKPGSGRQEQAVSVSKTRLERLAVPLTVLHANIQLLQRRIRKGTVPEPEALLRTLEKLERASRTLSAELRELHQAVSTTCPIDENMEETPPQTVHDRGERDT